MEIFAFKFGNDGNFVKIGTANTKQDSSWYEIGEKIVSRVKSLDKGDNVEIRYKNNNGQRILTFVKKLDNDSSANQVSSEKSPSYGNTSKNYGSSQSGQYRTPEEITKQNIGHMSANSIQGIEGVDVNNYAEIIKNLYDLYSDLVT